MLEVELLEAFEELPPDLRGPLLKAVRAIQKAVGESVRREDFLKLEGVVNQLAEAQKKTENVLTKLVEDHSETRKRLESMSDAVGYELENKSYRALPTLLKRDLNLQVEGKLLRRYVLGPDGKRYIQINIYGWGKRNGEKVLILGEAKTSLSKREVNKFMKHVKLLSSLEGVHENHILTVAVVHSITPDVEKYAKEKGIKIYWSYDLDQ